MPENDAISGLRSNFIKKQCFLSFRPE